MSSAPRPTKTSTTRHITLQLKQAQSSVTASSWLPMHPNLDSLRVFQVSGFERMLVFYRPLPEGVEILRVVHGSRNLRTLLRHETLE